MQKESTSRSKAGVVAQENLTPYFFPSTVSSRG